MDVAYFLKKRTRYIRLYYDQCTAPFVLAKHQIENELPPFDSPPYTEDYEPPYLEEWMDAETGIQIVGLSCVSLLSESLKLYFESLQNCVIHFDFIDEKRKKEAFKKGFVSAYTDALGCILDTDWSDCPADLRIIEQIVLARNRCQHGNELTSFRVSHDQHTLEKHPEPFFLNQRERELWLSEDGTVNSWFLMPSVEVTRESLFAAIEHVEKLADWIEGRQHKAEEWRRRNREE